jgi:23S rRNA (uracil1939-C5)-methyltransferase
VRRVLEILELAQAGEGVGRLEARAVFVPYAAPGDRVAADVPEGTGPAHAGLIEVLEPGTSRVDPPCPHFGPSPERGCGGCEWLHVAYSAQLAAKGRSLTETLRRIGGLSPGSYQAPDILPSPSPLRYRARAKFHVDRGTSQLVFFRRRSH